MPKRYIRTLDLWLMAIVWLVIDCLAIAFNTHLPTWAQVSHPDRSIYGDLTVLFFVAWAQLCFGARAILSEDRTDG